MLGLPPDDLTSYAEVVLIDRQSEPVWNAPGVADLQSSTVIRDIDDDTSGLLRAVIHDSRVLEDGTASELPAVPRTIGSMSIRIFQLWCLHPRPKPNVPY